MSDRGVKTTALDDVLGHLPGDKRAEYARIVGRYGISENAAEIVSVALIIEAIAPIVAEMGASIQTEREKVEGATAGLPDVLRASAVEIVRGLAKEVGAQTASWTADVVEAAVGTHLEAVRKQNESVTTSARAAADAGRKAAESATSSVRRVDEYLDERVRRLASLEMLLRAILSDFLCSKIPTLFAGALVGVIVGIAVRWSPVMFERVTQCSVRVERVAHALRLGPPDANTMRDYICVSGS